jgi:predicted transglutaminase-like cysteine proteinase
MGVFKGGYAAWCAFFAVGLIAAIAGQGEAASADESMVTGGLTSQPIGHYEFCRANPAECSIRPTDRGPEATSQRLWKKVAAINASVNRSIKPMNDFDVFGKDEVWSYPKNVGDCEDYVLEKRRELAAAGISLSNLLITVVRKRDGEGHAVLTFRSDRGDYVLDNLTDTVRPWEETGYRFLKRQAATHTGRWVTIRDGVGGTLVGAVK